MKHFLNNPDSLDDAISKSPSEHRMGFKLFALDPIEHDIVTKLKNPKTVRKQQFPGKLDQMAGRTREKKTFETGRRDSKIRVLGTDELLHNLSVLNFKELRNNSSDVVRERSRELLNRLCDKDKTYYEDEMEKIKKKMKE